MSQWTKGLGLYSFEYKKNLTDATAVAYIEVLTELGTRLLAKKNVPRGTVRKMAEETYAFEKKISEVGASYFHPHPLCSQGV